MSYLFVLCISCIIIEMYHALCYSTIRNLTYKNRLISKITAAQTKIVLASLKLDIVLSDCTNEEDAYIKETAHRLLPSALAIGSIIKTMPPYKETDAQLMALVFTKKDKRELGLYYLIDTCYIIGIIGIFRELMLIGQTQMAWILLALILFILPAINAINHFGPKDKIDWWYKVDVAISVYLYLKILVTYVFI